MLPACCHERYCSSSSERLDYPSGAGCSPARRGYLEPSLRPEGAPMPPRGVKKGTKRARQYEHIKESQREQGQSEDRAEEIAARTVNKEKARGGVAHTVAQLHGRHLVRPARGSAPVARGHAAAHAISSTTRRKTLG